MHLLTPRPWPLTFQPQKPNHFYDIPRSFRTQSLNTLVSFVFELWKMHLLTLPPWPLTFQPQNHIISRISQGYPRKDIPTPSLNTLGSFVFKLCSRQTDRQTDRAEYFTLSAWVIKHSHTHIFCFCLTGIYFYDQNVPQNVHWVNCWCL